MQEYNHKKIEKEWQEKWEKNQTYKTDTNFDKPKQYILDMFPYPSGEGLHVGHPRGYIATDIYSRMKRMQGFEVLHPMGWDAFGLPAENYAIKNKVHPSVAVKENVARFKQQLSIIGLDYDWSKEIDTTDPAFYKWTQWIFLQMYKKGLAYESNEPINWCPSCQTGLANEDVEADGTCERCGTKVEQKPMRQWVLKITDYADRMLADLDKLPKWPDGVKEAQRHWIGKSEGSEIDFAIKNTTKSGEKPNYLILHGWTGRADKNFIPWIKQVLENRGFEVQAPQMPNTDNPKEEEQVSYVLENCCIDKNTIIVGHSLGAVVAMKLLQKINQPIEGLVLVAPAIEAGFAGAEERIFWKNFSWDISYDDLIRLTNFRVVVSDILEKQTRGAYLDFLSKKLQARFVEGEAKRKHFLQPEEPVVLQAFAPSIKIFTTRADTLFGVTYVVFAPEHPLVASLKNQVPNTSEVEKYIEETKNKDDITRTAVGKEKTGVKLEGIFAINPANGEEVSVWVADYVLPNYGTGAVMAVPAHDERDFVFDGKYNIGAKEVVQPIEKLNNEYYASLDINRKCYIDEGILINSGKFNGFTSKEARQKITEAVGGKIVTKYRIKDWVFSRQRYWGEPIPIIHCPKCGVVPVPEKDLPVTLPNVENYAPTGTGESPLADIAEWINVPCPTCGEGSKRETNTMPQWAGSSWYYLRFIDPKNTNALIDTGLEKKWTPVDVYVGGDHATRHLIYARFWHKFLFDIGVVTTEEPFPRLEFLGFILAHDGRKMSKRWGNIVNPDEMVERFGADSFRLYEMFIGPFEYTALWNTNGLVGTSRFLERVWRLKDRLQEGNSTDDATLHKTIKKIGEDIEGFKFNTAVSAMMICVNEMEKMATVSVGDYKRFLQILAPFAPHMTEELWHELGESNSIHHSTWPTFDVTKLESDTVTITLSINGKAREQIVVAKDMSQADVEALAKASEKIQAHLNGVEPKRVIYVQGKLVNFVI